MHADWRERDATPPQRSVQERLDGLGHVEASQALSALHEGQASRAGGRLDQAIALFRFGIDTLGDRYASPDLLDDTGAKLALANLILTTEKREQAATLFERVLESRTAVYVKRHGAK